MKFNINETVRVRLTPNGKNVYANYLKQFKNIGVNQNVPEQLEMPLWEFCQIFGQEMYNGNPRAPFTVNNEIDFIQK